MLLNNNNIQRWIRSCVVITALLLALSCGGGGGTDPQPGTGNGKVALFITDNISFYKQVVATITGIRLVNSGTGGICEVLGTPVTLDIANLTNMAQYVNLAQCPAGHYNRIDIEFRRSVHLMDQRDATSACAFTSFIHESGERRSLACNPDTGICTLGIRGGDRDGSVLVQEDRYNDLGIDFDLKKFTVADFGNPSACSVTMTVYPVSATDMNSSGRAHSVTGGITDLDVAADTFVLSAGTTTLTVDYSGILPSLQPNIDKLLVAAQADGLSVNVLTGDVDLATRSISANRIFVKAAGTVSGVKGQPQQLSFVLTYQPAHQPEKTIAGSLKPQTDDQGSFVDGAWVNVKFDGYDDDDKKAAYLAAAIEVLPAGTVIDD